MINQQILFSWASAVTFTIYGIVCLTTDHMVEEFIRYGLLKFRTLTGVLETLGGVGTLIGLYYSKPIYIISTGGLALLMLLGVAVRLKIRDPLPQILPAFILMGINLALVVSYILKS